MCKSCFDAQFEDHPIPPTDDEVLATCEAILRTPGVVVDADGTLGWAGGAYHVQIDDYNTDCDIEPRAELLAEHGDTCPYDPPGRYLLPHAEVCLPDPATMAAARLAAGLWNALDEDCRTLVCGLLWGDHPSGEAYRRGAFDLDRWLAVTR